MPENHAEPKPMVKIVDPGRAGDFLLIAYADYDAAVHKLWDDKPPPAPVEPIPADWETLPWQQLKSLAAKFGESTNSEVAAATIRAELAKRAGAPS